MLWFKILLMVIIALTIINDTAKAGGWQPEAPSPLVYAISAVLETLLIVGIWVWL